MQDSTATRPSVSPPAAPERPALPPRRSSVRERLVGHVDRRIAALAHLSIGFGIVIGVGFLLGLAINLVIWLRSRHSPFVARHAEQAGAYQLAVLLTNVLIVGIWIAVVVSLLGGSEIGPGQLSLRQIFMGLWLALLPLQILWYFGTILYGVYAGLMVAVGKDFSYPIFGAWAARRIARREAAA